MRTILLHVNAEVPEDFRGTPDELAFELTNLVSACADPEYTPLLCEAGICVPLAEEV